MADDGEVVTDEDKRNSEFLLQFLDKVDDLGLDGNIEGGDRLIADDQLRFEDHGPGDAYPLALATGEFMGISIDHQWQQADLVHDLLYPVSPLLLGEFWKVYGQRFGDDLTDSHAWVEGSQRILKDDLQLFSYAGHLGGVQPFQVFTAPDHLSGGWREELQDSSAQRRFPASGFPDDAQGLACPELKADIIDGLQGNWFGKEFAGTDGKIDLQARGR